jgi:hypothetical protein
MTYVPRWLKIHRESEQAWKAREKAECRWQAWCPFCGQDTEHAHASPAVSQDQNTRVSCAKCHRLHAVGATRPQSN